MNNIFEDIKKKNGEIIIWGCGGHARSIINSIRQTDDEIKITLVDKNAGNKEKILGCNVYREYDVKKSDAIIVAYGDNKKREQIYRKLKEVYSGQFISIISEKADIGIACKIGEGTFVAMRTFVGPEARIGSNTILNTNCVIEHEVSIGNHVHIAPNVTVCGKSFIGNNVLCGAGSTVIDKIKICDNVILGAGAVVVNDIRDSGVYMGVPARKFKEI